MSLPFNVAWPSLFVLCSFISHHTSPKQTYCSPEFFHVFSSRCLLTLHHLFKKYLLRGTICRSCVTLGILFHFYLIKLRSRDSFIKYSSIHFCKRSLPPTNPSDTFHLPPAPVGPPTLCSHPFMSPLAF